LHLEFAATYIHKQSQIENPFGRGGSTITGTGGTPFMKYLKKHRDETQKQKINN
jgi:indoleamine 2,3-dioxygenase